MGARGGGGGCGEMWSHWHAANKDWHPGVGQERRREESVVVVFFS